MYYEFVFYYESSVKVCGDKKVALKLFQEGGFFKAVCNFVGEHPSCFRVLEKAEDITSLK